MIVIFAGFVFLLGYVPTSSMEPTLKKGSYILGLRVYQELNVGDVVVFEHEGRLLVKRIAADAGESTIRGDGRLEVPEGYYYMLGDNPGNSYDGRFWEEPFVSQEQIVARVIV